MTQHHPVAVLCRTCGHGYDGHAAHGGPCAAPRDPSPAGLRCSCTGFRWVDPDAPPVRSYADPPVTPA